MPSPTGTSLKDVEVLWLGYFGLPLVFSKKEFRAARLYFPEENAGDTFSPLSLVYPVKSILYKYFGFGTGKWVGGPLSLLFPFKEKKGAETLKKIIQGSSLDVFLGYRSRRS